MKNNVYSVNGELPDKNGNVEVDAGSGETGFIDKPEFMWVSYRAPEGETVTEFEIELPDYNETTDNLEFYRWYQMFPNGYVEILSYNDPIMSIRVHPDWAIRGTNDFFAYKYRYKLLAPINANVINDLKSNSPTDALSANQGRVLDEKIAVVADDAEYISEALKAHMQQYANNDGDPGHVKVDGSTITIDNNGVISANSTSGFKIDNSVVPSQAPSTYNVGVTVSYIPVDHVNNAEWLSFYGTYYYNSNSSTFKMNFIVTTVKDSTDKTTQTVRMYGNKPKTNFELTTATRTSNDDADTWMTPLATMPIQRNSGTPTAWKNALAGTLYYDHSSKTWFYKKFDGANDISDLDWAPLVPTVVNNTFTPVEDDDQHIYSAYTVERMFEGAKNNLKNNVKLNRIWDSRTIERNATTWTVDFSDEPDLTDLNNYDFEVYDDGVLVFGNPITHVINNDDKTVTFTPRTPMARNFTITCIGRGMEFN